MVKPPRPRKEKRMSWEKWFRYRMPETWKEKQMTATKKKFERYSEKHVAASNKSKKGPDSGKDAGRLAVLGMLLIAWATWWFLKK